VSRENYGEEEALGGGEAGAGNGERQEGNGRRLAVLLEARKGVEGNERS